MMQLSQRPRLNSDRLNKGMILRIRLELPLVFLKRPKKQKHKPQLSKPPKTPKLLSSKLKQLRKSQKKLLNKPSKMRKKPTNLLLS